MKQLLLVIICTFFLLLMPGCDRSSPAMDIPPDNTAILEKFPFEPLDKDHIAWMTMTGGLGGMTTKILYTHLHEPIINKIVGMLNENDEMLAEEKETMDMIYRRVRPIGLTISFLDAKTIYLWPSYEIIYHFDSWTVSPLTDRFTMQVGEKYYTLFSHPLANYLNHGWKGDFPIVNDLIISTDTSASRYPGLVLREGDKITVSGDGCSSAEVNIFIRKNVNGERWQIGCVETVYGEWKWDGVVNRVVKTPENVEIELGEGVYDLIVQFGDIEKTVNEIMILGNT